MDGANRIQCDGETQVGERATEEKTGDKHGGQDDTYVVGGMSIRETNKMIKHVIGNLLSRRKRLGLGCS